MSWDFLKWLSVVVCAISLSSWGCNAVSGSCGELSFRVAGALEKALGFFAREYDQVNLDAVVGLRMTQSQLQSAVAELDFDSDPQLKSLRGELESLSAQAGWICDQAIPVVKRQHHKEYRDLGKLASDKFWKTSSVLPKKRRTDPSLGSAPHQPAGVETLNEPLTDKCISQLLGTKFQPCSISPSCWHAMTPRGYRSYSLSHQVLYLIVGSMMGCESHIMKRFHSPGNGPADGPLLDSLTDGFCSDILTEAEDEAKKGFPVASQDLFMEQVLLCGLKGYEDFFQLPWLQAVLGWQDDSGCFTDGVYRPQAAEKEKVEHEYQAESDRKREKRREKKLTDSGCLVHKTAVGAGFLSVYLRMLLETMATGTTKTNCLDS